MLEVAVAPGAIAHKLAEQRVSSTVQCSLPLLEPDGEHPSEEGLYYMLPRSTWWPNKRYKSKARALPRLRARRAYGRPRRWKSRRPPS